MLSTHRVLWANKRTATPPAQRQAPPQAKLISIASGDAVRSPRRIGPQQGFFRTAESVGSACHVSLFPLPSPRSRRVWLPDRKTGAPTHSAGAWLARGLYLKFGAVIVATGRSAHAWPPGRRLDQGTPAVEGAQHGDCRVAQPDAARIRRRSRWARRRAAEDGRRAEGVRQAAAFKATYSLFRPLFYPIFVVLP